MTLPAAEMQKCWLGWMRLGAKHVHRCGQLIGHPGLHTCTACGGIYIRPRPEVRQEKV